jgi:hypothetical protein
MDTYWENIDNKQSLWATQPLGNGGWVEFKWHELKRVADIESIRRLRTAAAAIARDSILPSVQRSIDGGRAFLVVTAVAWKSLSLSVTSLPSLDVFRW